MRDRMSQGVFMVPAPAGRGIAGNLIDLGNYPLEFLTRCRDYGEIVA
ncbi:hypothetical protein Cha6605_3974 [Chamaesiphon minutus PCC 6605]|uniref:Uncharacterized protein n=1 Tax=Chamaesiphon minutus (strain ATCC 27169 / PCC 6605) TaxID=1173020 RepID=K9UKG5_CHAP6|nr:hypothetical protein Cha6605_3974 [Chamaesiphon minutus PCC 6605]